MLVFVVGRLTREYFAHMVVKGYKIRAFKKKKILYLAKPPVSWSLVVCFLFLFFFILFWWSHSKDRVLLRHARDTKQGIYREFNTKQITKNSFISDGAFNT